MRRRLTSVLVVVVVAASACSGGGDDDPGSSGTDNGGGGILRMALERPASLDPAAADRALQHETILADLLFDGLTAVDPDSGEAVPSVASTWSPRDDMTIWTFKIAGGAKFHDGTPITSADVKATLERVARRGTSSAASVQLEQIGGYRKFAVEGDAEGLKGVRTPDASTVEIRLARSSPNLPLLLANPVYGIVPANADQPTDPPFAEDPLGSGPFDLTGTVDDDGELTELRLRAVEGSGMSVSGIDVVFVDDAAAGYALFVDGDVDVARVPTDKVAEAEGTYGASAFEPYVAELLYGLNLTDDTFAEAGFREAILAAIDRQAIVDDIYGGTVDLLDAMVPAGVPGHRDDACPKCVHDPDAARGLLAEAFGDGEVPRVAIDFDKGEPQDSVAAKISEDLAAVGIPTVLRPRAFDGPDNYQDHLASGRARLFRLGWVGSMPAPEVFLSPLFETGSPDNVTGYSDDDVDDLFAEARATADAAKRRELLAEAERAILADVPIIPIAQFRTHLVVSSRVTGLVPTVMGSIDMSRVTLTAGG